MFVALQHQNFKTMKSEEKEFTPIDSLQIIRSMIESTRHSLYDSSPYFLLWGWAVMIACVTQFLMLLFKNPNHSLSWAIIIPITLVVYFIMIFKQAKKEKVKTFVGEANGFLWTALGSCFIVFPFIFSKIGWQFCLPFYILIYGVGTFVSGKLMDYKPLVYGGVICYPLAIITPYVSYNYQLLLASLAILVSYIIPGHLLRAHYKKVNTL